MEQTLEMFIDELVNNEEFRDSFFRSPRVALETADEWGLPFSASEIRSLLRAQPWVWNRVADELGSRLQQAA